MRKGTAAALEEWAGLVAKTTESTRGETATPKSGKGWETQGARLWAREAVM